MEWTEELIARLRDLWDQGLPTAEIGRQLLVSKNAVVGKAHRLKLPSRPSPIRNKGALEGGKAATSRKRNVRSQAKKTVGEEFFPEGSKKERTVKAGPKASSRIAVSKSQKEVVQPVVSTAEREAFPRVQKPVERAQSAVKTVEDKGKNATRVETSSSVHIAVMPKPFVASAAAPVRKVTPPRRMRDPLERTTRQGPTCQWPYGNPGEPDFRFCGATPLSGKPYCAEHAAVAYVKIRDRRE